MCPPDERDRTEPLPDEPGQRPSSPRPRRVPLGDETLASGDETLASGDPTAELDPDATWPQTPAGGGGRGERTEPLGDPDLTELEPDDEGTLVRDEGWTEVRPSRPRRAEATEPLPPGGADETAVTGAPRSAPRRDEHRTPPREAAADAGQVFAGRFEVVEVLGEGGMGRVYRVRDRQIEGRAVALKVLRPKYSRNAKFRELFFQEIHAAQNFVSEHVNQVRDTGQMSDGQLFLTMDMVEGESLAALLSREGALSSAHALEIARQMLLGLQSGHEKGFVHRDVKPGNVMLRSGVPRTEENPFGVGVQLLDFGIAALAASLEEGTTAGTPRYMSPEQVQGERLDPRSDLFAVGVVLFRMLSGKMPFDGKTLDEVKTSILQVDVGPSIEHLEGLAAPVGKILRKALQKDRKKRFQSAAEFVEAIEKLQEKAEKRGAPAWVVSLTVLLALSTAALGVLYNDQVQAARVSETRLESRQGDKDQEIARLQQRIQDLNVRIEGLMTPERADELVLAGLDRWKRENEWERKQEFFDEWYTRIEGGLESERLTTEVESLRSKVERLEGDLANLERRNSELERLSNVMVRQAQGFENVLNLLQQDRNAYARTEYDKLLGDQLFRTDDATGGQLLDTLLDLHGHLVSLERAVRVPNSTIADGLEQAGTMLSGAREQLELLGSVSVPWLTVATVVRQESDLDADGTQARRLGQVEAMLDHFQERVANLERLGELNEQERSDEIARRWEEYLAAPADSDPTNVLAFAREFGQDPSPVAERYLEFLEQRFLGRDIFPLADLRKQPALEVWGRELAGGGSELARSETGLELRLAWAALRWYGQRAKPDELADEIEAVSAALSAPTSAAPRHDWRLQFVLQAGALANQPDWLTDGWQAVYHHRFLEDGTVWWWKHDGRSRGAGRWEVSREHYIPGKDRSPQEAEMLRVELTEALEVWINDEERLDAYALGSELRVALWRPELPTPPAGTWWARGMDFERFAGETRAEPLVCLVVDTPQHETWFSPRFGLVREVKKGNYPAERELAYRETNR